jgi:hypothetical protein
MEFRTLILRVALPLAALALRSEAQGIRGVTRRTPTVVYGQNASQFFAAGGVPLNAPTNVGSIPGSPQGAPGAGLAQQGRPLPQGIAMQPGYPAGNAVRLPAGHPSRTPASMAARQPQGPPNASRSATTNRPASQAGTVSTPTRKSPQGSATR